ncbi:unnamed protein product, partial [Polarella glacialis]
MQHEAALWLGLWPWKRGGGLAFSRAGAASSDGLTTLHGQQLKCPVKPLPERGSKPAAARHVNLTVGFNATNLTATPTPTTSKSTTTRNNNHNNNDDNNDDNDKHEHDDDSDD